MSGIPTLKALHASGSDSASGLHRSHRVKPDLFLAVIILTNSSNSRVPLPRNISVETHEWELREGEEVAEWCSLHKQETQTLFNSGSHNESAIPSFHQKGGSTSRQKSPVFDLLKPILEDYIHTCFKWMHGTQTFMVLEPCLFLELLNFSPGWIIYMYETIISCIFSYV